ncbi:MAG: DUF3619 family protein [Cytophagales bacterium]|nr:DUF3619 family protein [Cytophagales bacterium]
MTHKTIFVTQDHFAANLMAHFNAVTNSVTPDIAERLRFARQRALDAQKVAQLATTTSLAPQTGGTAVWGGGRFDFFSKWSTVLPLIALIVGLIAINQVQNDYRAKELADIDAEILIDDLPPVAYTDQGFGQFLKSQMGR